MLVEPDLPSADAAAGPRRLSVDTATNLAALRRLGDPALSGLTRLAQSISGAEAAAVHLFDATHQHRVAAVGAPLERCAAEDSMCRHVLVEGVPIVTADATREPRFVGSPFVEGEDPVRFYASFPLAVGGVPVGTLCTFGATARELDADQYSGLQELAELARTHLELMQIATDLGRDATIDALTGAVNRVMFDDRIAGALAERQLTGGPVCLTIIDVDDFKPINDTYGHDRGDAALAFLGERLRAAAGPFAVVGRLGGDEFGVLTGPVPPAELETGLAGLNRAADGFDPPFTISLGSAFAEDGDDVRALMRRADQLMYRAKAGRVRSSDRLRR